MKPIPFPARLSSGATVTITGWPTGATGLLVNEFYGPCPDHGTTPCWVVSHQRTGFVFPWCWTSPEAALAFAQQAAGFGDWTITGDALRRRMSSGTRRALDRYARDLGALGLPPHRLAEGDGQ